MHPPLSHARNAPLRHVRGKPIPAEVERLSRLSDRDLRACGTDRVTLGAQVLRALHGL